MKDKITNKNNLFAELFGWYGTAAILIAYGLVSFSIIKADGLIYQFLNFSGSVGLLAIALVKKVYQSVTINIIWGLIALIALAQIIF